MHNTTVRPRSRVISEIRARTAAAPSGSSPDVGSSRKSTSGSERSALARATRRRCPVEKPRHSRSASRPRSKRSSRSLIVALIAAPRRPRSAAVISRFSRGVSRSSTPAFSVSTDVLERTVAPWAMGSRPSTDTEPESGVSTPLRSRIVVVLPAPLWPSRARTEPSGIENDTSDTTSRSPNRRVRSRHSMAAARRGSVTGVPS